ncbi:MAG TPA: DUF4331 family protein [Armatimonadota bacterium]|nr:DUF4331 family protein [Armatimonadota bacterium]
MKHWTLKLFGLLAALGMMVITTTPAQPADHRDAPGIQEDPTADLLDAFIFRNPNNGNVVMAVTINPFLVAGVVQIPFSPDVLYQFKIDNTGDYVEDKVVQIVFDQVPTIPFGPLANPAPAQQFRVIGPGSPSPKFRGAVNHVLNFSRNPTFTGPANGTTVGGPNGIRAWVGMRDDPFFLDFIWVLGIVNGRPLSRPPGLDTIAGLNCSVMVVEVPAAMLRGSNGDTVFFWATSSRGKITKRVPAPTRATFPTNIPFFRGDTSRTPFVQVERNGFPVINTVLIPTPLKDAFNRSIPSKDPERFRAPAVTRVTQILGGNATQAAHVVDFLLPDAMPFNLSSNAGFPNGRRPEDDVIDTALQVLTGNPAITDNVQSNDRTPPVLPDFPFFAPPHTASEPVPGRN